MKASDWTIVTMLASLAVVCLGHPEGGRDRGREHGTGVGDSQIQPHDVGRQGINIGRSFNVELSTVEGKGKDSSFRGSEGGEGHASCGRLNDGYSVPSNVGESSGKQGRGEPNNRYSALENNDVHGGLENGIDGRFEESSSNGINPGGYGGLSGEHSFPVNGGLHGGDNASNVSEGGFDAHYTAPSVGGSHVDGDGGNDGSIPDTISGDYGGSGDINGGFTTGKGSAATAVINFNLGPPLNRNGGYSGANSISVGVHGGGGGGTADDGNGFIAGGSNGVVGGGYSNQVNLNRIVQGHNGYSGVNDRDGYGSENGNRFGGVDIVIHRVAEYSEPDIEQNGEGYKGVGSHIEVKHRSGGGDGGGGNGGGGDGGDADGGGSDGEGYNNKVNVGGIVSSNNGDGEVRESETVGGGGVNIGGENGGGSSEEYGGANTNEVVDFRYSGSGSDHNGSGYDGGVGGQIEIEHNDGDGEGDRGYNPTERNGVLVGGGVGGIYLTSPSNDEAYSVSAGADGVTEADYSVQAVRESGISAGGYSGSEVNNNGNGPVDLYSSPGMGGGSGTSGVYSSVSSDGGNIGHQTGSIVQSGILEVEFSAPDNSGGYGDVVVGRGSDGL